MSQSLLLSSNLPAASPDLLAQGMPSPGKGDPQSAESGGIGAFSKVLQDQITDLNKASQPIEKNSVVKFSPGALQVAIAPESVPDLEAASSAPAGIGMPLDALEALAPSPLPPGAGLVEGEMPSGKPLPATRQGMSRADEDEGEGQGPLTLVTWAFPSATPLPVPDVGDIGSAITEPAVPTWPARSTDPSVAGRGTEPPSIATAGVSITPVFQGIDDIATVAAGSPPVETPVLGREGPGFSPAVDAMPVSGSTLRHSGPYGVGAGNPETGTATPVFSAGAIVGAGATDVAPVVIPDNASAHRRAASDTVPARPLTSPGTVVSASGPDIPRTGEGSEVPPSVRRSGEIEDAFLSVATGTGDASRAPSGSVIPPAAHIPRDVRSPDQGVPETGRELNAMDADRIGARNAAEARAVPGLQAVPGEVGKDEKSSSESLAGRVVPASITAPRTGAATPLADEASGSALPLSPVPEGESSGSLRAEGAGRVSGVAPSSAATVRPDAGVFLGGNEAEPSDTYAPGMTATYPVAADPARRAMYAPASRSALDTVIPSDTLRAAAPSPRAPAPLATPTLMSPIDAPAAPITPTAPADAVTGRMQPSETRARAEPAAPVPASSIIPPTAMREVTDAQDLRPRPAPDGSIPAAPVQSATTHDASGHTVSAPRPYTPEPPPSTVPAVAASASGAGTPPSVVDATSLPAGDDRTLGSSDDALSSLSALSARGAPAEQGLPAPASFASTAVRAADALAQTPALPQAPGSLPLLLGAATGRLGEELGHRILWLSGHNLRSAEIQLDPPELGPLQIQVHSHRDGASIQFTAHTAAARDAVESNLPRLRELLEGSGLNLLDVNVAQQQQRGARSDRDAPESGNPNARNRLSGIGQVGEASAPARRSLGLVDDYA